MSKFQDEVGRWANCTFTEATTASICAHLKREVLELDEAVANLRTFTPRYPPPALKNSLAMEAADCYMLLLHLCHRNQIDLEATAQEKFEINKRRKWGKPDAEGVVEHIEETND